MMTLIFQCEWLKTLPLYLMLNIVESYPPDPPDPHPPIDILKRISNVIYW